MPVGNPKDYEVSIPIVAKDDTAKGSRSALSNLDRMALQAARAADQRALSAQNSAQRMVEAERRNAMGLARDKERYAQQAAMAERRYAEQSAREQVRYAQQAAREKERYAQQSSRELVRWQQRADLEQRRIYEQNLKAFQRVEQERVKAAQRAEEQIEQNRRRNIDRARRIGSGTEQVGRSVQGAGTALTVGVTAPIVAAGAAIIKIGSSYEQAMNILQATSSATAAQMDAVSKKAIALGADISLPATSAVDATKAMLELSKAGFTIEQSMAAAKGVLQLAAAAQIEEAQAAEITANALNAFNLKASDSTRIADLLAATANASSVEILDVSAAMQQAGAVFAANNIPIETMVGLIGQLGNAGIKGSDAGTSLKTMLVALTAPTNKAASEMQSMGVSVFDAQGKMRPFREIVEQMSGSLGKMTQQQQAAALKTIFGTDAMRAATIIFGQGTKAYDEMALAVTKEGAAADLAAARTKGLAGAWEAIKSQLETLALIIYLKFREPLTEAMVTVAEFVSGAVEWFTKFSETHPQITLVAGAVLAFVAAIGPLLVGLGAVIAVVGTAVSGIASMAGALSTAAAAVGGFGPLVLAAIGAVAQFMVVLAAVGIAIYGLYQAWISNFAGIRDFTMEIVSALQGAFNAGLSLIQNLWAKYGAGILATATRVWNAVSEAVTFVISLVVNSMRENFGFIVEWVQGNWPLISQTVEKVMTIIGSAVQKWLNIVLGLWERHGGAIKEYVAGIWGAISSSIGTFIKVILGVIKMGMQIIQGDWSGAWSTLKQIVSDAFWGIVGFLKGIGGAILGALKFALGVVWDLVTWIYDQAYKLGVAIAQGIVAGLKSLKNWAISEAVLFVTDLTGATRRALESKSPSMVYFRMGRDMGLGLVLGLASMQVAAQEQIKRLVIPERPEMASGKGSEKVNAARRKADAPNRPAYDLLEKVYQDIDQLAPAGQKTKTLAVAAELAKVKYNETAQAIKDALVEAARFYDSEKANIAVEESLGNQLDATAKKLLEFKYSAKEGATEVEKFNLWLAQLRDESPETAAALDKHATMINRVRAAWASVDAAEKQRDIKAAAESLSKAVADMADESMASLRNMGTEGDTQLEKLIGQFSNLKGLGITLAQLDPLKAIVQSVRDLPEPERLKAISEALRQIIEASGVGTLGLSPEQQGAFLRNVSKALDAAGSKDALDATTKATTAYGRALSDLNGKLDDTSNQTERARLEKELETEAYKDLTRVQKDALLQRASEVDALLAQTAATKQFIDTIRGYAEAAGDAISDSLVEALTGNIGEAWRTLKDGFRDLWRTIISDLVRSGIHRMLSSILDSVLGGLTGKGTAGNGGGIFGGGGGANGGGGVGSIIQNVIGKLFGGGSATDGGITVPGSSSGFGSVLAAATQRAQGVSASSAGLLSGGGGAASGGGLMASLAGMAPILGIGLGASLGGGLGRGSALGGGMGMIGGGILGAYAGVIGAGIIGGGFASGSAMASIATTMGAAAPFLLPIAAGLLIGAYILGKKKQRDEEEKKRTELGGQVYDQTIQILNAARAGELTLSQAEAAFARVESEYMSAISGFKDSKTKRIARDWFYNDFKPFYLPLIQQGAKDGAKAKQFTATFSPTFQHGGGVWTKMADGGLIHESLMSGNNTFYGRVPGPYDRKDNRYIAVTGDEVVLKPEDWRPIEQHLIRRKVPGFGGSYADSGGVWTGGGGAPPRSSDGQRDNGSRATLTVQRIVVNINEATGKAEVVFEGLRDARNQEAVLNLIEKDITLNREDSRIIRAERKMKEGG